MTARESVLSQLLACRHPSESREPRFDCKGQRKGRRCLQCGALQFRYCGRWQRPLIVEAASQGGGK
jgi:hypothetical protein